MKNTFLIYGISDCPSCLRACADLMDIYPSCEYVFINADFAAAYRDSLKQKYDVSTFPIIVCNDKLIGGYEELSSFLATHEQYNDNSTPMTNKKVEPS